ncbi:hypothetical protein HTIA_1334 [Halorhabdus tiamatea SARL4B]|uniref:Uncharacterized protein n=1 Tax=Halorhabdus tiamatea SARL4B TaxID=1033806 RepID=S6CU12_9EURY|nr:hypothetical protein HTIA_1334 [Halorhabdus tiamatea SARL4B]
MTVTRSLRERGDGVLGSIEIRSERAESVLVHVVEEFPAHLPVRRATFEPGSEPAEGTITDEYVSIRHEVVEDSCQIRYGVVVSGPVDDLEWGPPRILSVRDADADPEPGRAAAMGIDHAETSESDPDRPARFEQDNIERGDEDHVRPSIQADPSRTDPEPTAPATDDADASDRESNEREEPSQKGSTDREATPTTAGRSPSPSPDRTVATEGAEPGGDTARDIEVRLDHLSARVAEFEAYATALEPIVSEHGSGTDIVDAFDRRIEEIDSRVDTLEGRVTGMSEEHTEAVEKIHDAIDRVEGRTDDVEETLTRIDGDLAQQRENLSTLEETLESVEAELGTLDTEGAEVQSNVATLERTVTDVSREVAALNTQLEAFRDELAELRAFRDSLAEITTFEE